MKDAIQFAIGGIKCDNLSCDYMDQSVELKDYSNWLNKPCPKCGSNLLTQADYDNVKAIVELAEIMNKSIGPVADNATTSTATVRMNGTGKVEIEIGE